jgi:hypothetical protein
VHARARHVQLSNPVIVGTGVELTHGFIDSASPQFEKAARACKSVIPTGTFSSDG